MIHKIVVPTAVRLEIDNDDEIVMRAPQDWGFDEAWSVDQPKTWRWSSLDGRLNQVVEEAERTSIYGIIGTASGVAILLLASLACVWHYLANLRHDHDDLISNLQTDIKLLQN